MRLGNFEILEKLGEGGMGIVYLAQDLRLDRLVALKQMHAHLATVPQFQLRFEQEAKTIARLKHPNIIKILFTYIEDNTVYLVMDYLPSGNLRSALQHQPDQRLNLRTTFKLVSQIASALNYAHENGIIHRDVKPDNILLDVVPTLTGDTEPSAVLTDFGLVKVAEAVGYQTQANTAIGTLPYMAPEQFTGRPIDHRVDIYALGIMFYEMLVGRLPFSPTNVAEAHHMHVLTAAPRPSHALRELTPELDRLILTALAKDPAERYQTGNELVRAIHRFEQDSHAYQTALESLDEVATPHYAPMVTWIESRIAEQEAPLVRPASNLSHDRVVITGATITTRLVDLLKPSLAVGSNSDNDVCLTGPEMAPVHAFINRQPDGSYRVVDNNSASGTWMGEQKLLSHVPQTWLDGQQVRIGSFYLTLQTRDTSRIAHMEAAPPAHTVVEPPSAPHVLPPLPQATQIAGLSHYGRSQVETRVERTQITLHTGTTTDVVMQVSNIGTTVEHYRVRVQGIPTAWTSVPEDELHLNPREQGTLTIRFQPPRHYSSTAGHHAFSYVVLSSQGIKLAEHPGDLEILPFVEIQSKLTPATLDGAGQVQYSLTNNGNAVERLTVTADDTERLLRFQPAETQVTLPPGHKVSITIDVDSRQPVQRDQTLAYTLRASAASHSLAPEIGHITLRRHIPRGEIAYKVIDPLGNRTEQVISADMLAMDVVRLLGQLLHLGSGTFTLANGKTGDIIPPGQTLAEAGIGEGGILWLQGTILAPATPTAPQASTQERTRVEPPPSIPTPAPSVPTPPPSEPSIGLAQPSLPASGEYLVLGPAAQTPTKLKLDTRVPVIEVMVVIRQKLRLPDGDWQLVDERNQRTLSRGETLQDAAIPPGSLLSVTGSVAAPTADYTIRRLSVVVVDLNGKSRRLTLPTNEPAIELTARIQRKLRLPKGTYNLILGRDNTPLAPGLTLADLEAPEGTVLVIQGTLHQLPPATYKFKIRTRSWLFRYRRKRLRLSPDCVVAEMGRRVVRKPGNYHLMDDRTGALLDPTARLADLGYATGGTFRVQRIQTRRLRPLSCLSNMVGILVLTSAIVFGLYLYSNPLMWDILRGRTYDFTTHLDRESDYVDKSGLTAGGDVAARFESDDACDGYISDKPQFRVRWNPSSDNLSIVVAPRDYWPIVRLPNGQWHCNNRNYYVFLQGNDRETTDGWYEIYLAQDNQGDTDDANLCVSRLSLNHARTLCSD